MAHIADNLASESQRKEYLLKEGSAHIKTINVVIMGVAGSGKTSTKDLLLNHQPKKERNSTPIRGPVIHVRPVTKSLYHTQGNDWREITQTALIDLLARAMLLLPQSSRMSIETTINEGPFQVSSSKNKDYQASANAGDVHTNGSKELQMERTKTTTMSLPFRHRQPQFAITDAKKAISKVTELVLKAMQRIDTGGAVLEQSQPRDLFGTKTIRVTDSGGQLQFQDIAPLFTRHASAGLFIFRLVDDFESIPCDEFYRDDKPIGPPMSSHISHKETMSSLFQSFMSNTTHRRKPLCAFIGTFYDKVVESKDSLAKNNKALLIVESKDKFLARKNQALLKIIPPDMRNQVYDSSETSVIFPLNACSRDPRAQNVAQQVRNMVEESPLSFNEEVPLSWFILEISLQHLCSILNRGVLTKNEYSDLINGLQLQPTLLNTTLNYFDKVCIVHYYPKILPNTIFVDPQVPLDKVSELIQRVFSLRNVKEGPRCAAIAGKWRRFRDEGILTQDILEEFPEHYIPGIFTPADMIAIMKELLIITPISLPDESDCSQEEFFMPTLLMSVSPTELEKHRVYEPADPLLIQFRSASFRSTTTCVRRGTFCCLVVYLIKKCNWEIFLPSGKAIFLKKNCIQFRLPGQYTVITLIDTFSHIEIHVEADDFVCQQSCAKIKKSILDGITEACKTLQYDDKFVTGIFCPHKGLNMHGHSDISNEPHFADIDAINGEWNCSKDIRVHGKLKLKHTVWINEFSGSQSTAEGMYRHISIEITHTLI